MSSFKKIWIGIKIASMVSSVVYGIINIIFGLVCLFSYDLVIIMLTSDWYRAILSIFNENYPGIAAFLTDAGIMQKAIVIESLMMGAVNFWLAWLVWRKLH